MPHQHDGTVIVLAPFADDAAVLVNVLVQEGINARSVANIEALASILGDEVGAVLVTEEALIRQPLDLIVDASRRQPSWSAYPFLLLLGQRRSGRPNGTIYSSLPPEIVNVVMMERPIGIAALTSAIRGALAARRRQFTTRNHLRELEHNANQQRLMTRELAHRVKNTIAVLQSIVTQTMRPYPDQAFLRATIVERFAALGRAHDLLLGKNFAAADFEALVRQALAVHAGNFDISGPSLELSPQASLSFALVLHELATNSSKYGAMTRQSGSVRVRWDVDDTDPGTSQFSFGWTEQGGPLVGEPTRKGFGTRLITNTLAGWGEATMDFASEGFRLNFYGPLSELTHSVVPASITASYAD